MAAAAVSRNYTFKVKCDTARIFFRKKKTAKKNFAVGCVLRVLGD